MIDLMNTPVDTGHRAGRMMEALIGSDNDRAKMVLTVEVEGAATYHQTFDIKKWKRRDESEILQVQVKGSADWERRIPPITVLSYNLTTREVVPPRDRRADDRMLVYAAEAALLYAWVGSTKQPSNGSVRVLEESVCGRCGLTLTDPTSIDRGIGPDCLGKMTGTTTIRGRKRATATEGQEALA